MKKKNFRLLIILCLCSIVFLAAAVIIIPKAMLKHHKKVAEKRQNRVEKYVKEQCPEDFTLISTNEHSDSFFSTTTEYTFETAGRKLTFTATTSTMPKYAVCNYKDTVLGLYYNRIEEELFQCPYYNDSSPFDSSPPDGYFNVYSYDQLEEIAETLEKCNQIYAEELAYNSAEFLKENPAAEIKLEYRLQNEIYNSDKILCTIPIDGSASAEDLLPMFSLSYAQLFKDYPDDNPGDVPKQYMDKVHVSNLAIIFNGQKLDATDYGDCWYNTEAGCYMVYLFVNNSSLLLYDYMDMLNVDYSTDSGGTTVYWESKDGNWELKRQQDEDGNLLRQGTKLSKNQKEIPGITEKNARYDDGEYIFVSVPIDDFASMLDLDYTIDEDDFSVSFTSKDIRKMNP